MQIIGQVASCLAELHSQGWVHRDLKPGNIMFLPRTASWTLIDFGLAARTGDAARIGFTPNYAAPEVVAANAAGDSCVTADSAVDAWALGVIAFELLNRRPAFEAFAAPGEVRPTASQATLRSYCPVLLHRHSVPSPSWCFEQQCPPLRQPGTQEASSGDATGHATSSNCPAATSKSPQSTYVCVAAPLHHKVQTDSSTATRGLDSKD